MVFLADSWHPALHLWKEGATINLHFWHAHCSSRPFHHRHRLYNSTQGSSSVSFIKRRRCPTRSPPPSALHRCKYKWMDGQHWPLSGAGKRPCSFLHMRSIYMQNMAIFWMHASSRIPFFRFQHHFSDIKPEIWVLATLNYRKQPPFCTTLVFSSYKIWGNDKYRGASHLAKVLI